MKTTFLILAACALSAAPGDITANVPFPFEFNGKAMPAGSYQIRPSADRHFHTAVHAKGPMFLFAAEPTSGVIIAQSFLQFQPAAGRYVLTAIVDKSTGAFMKLPMSRAAKEMAGGGYYFRAMQDAGTALAYNVNRTRKQVEQAQSAAIERVYIPVR